MNKNFYKNLIMLVALLTGLSSLSFAQTTYRSKQTGNWGDYNTWDRSTDGISFVPAIAGQLPTTNNAVIVSAGNVVSLEASGKNCLSLTILPGGQVTANGSAFSIRVGAGTSGNGGIIGTLQNDGIFGGVGDKIVLELPATAAATTITGSGTFEIARIRAITTNVNYPGSAAVGAAADAKLVIDANMILNVAGNYAYSITNSSQNVNDTITFTVNSGKTLTVSDPASYFHNNAVTTGLVSATGGKYTYNVFGTLDLSANPSTTGGSSLIPFANASSSINLNVSGLLKFGGYFKADTVSNSVGILNMTIKNGGLVDATLTTKLTTGKRATASGDLFFVTEGTGALKRNAPGDGTPIAFPVGYTRSSYTPVGISNTGTADNFTVSVQNTFTNPPPAQTLLRQWNIAEQVAGGSNVGLAFSWTTADEVGSGLNHANPISIIHWNGTGWDYTPALVTGDGSAANPWVAAAAGFTSFSPFGVTSFGTTPVAFVSLKAAQKGNGIMVDFGNATESDMKNYIIEKSNDGRNFISINTLEPKTNNGSLNTYSYLDNAPYAGTNFYRIKAVEKSGVTKFSTVVKVTLGKGTTGINVYPNPVKGGQVNLQLGNIVKGAYTVNLYNNLGQRVFTSKINHDGGSATQLVELPTTLTKGMYNLQVTGELVRLNKSLMVQ